MLHAAEVKGFGEGIDDPVAALTRALHRTRTLRSAQSLVSSTTTSVPAPSQLVSNASPSVSAFSEIRFTPVALLPRRTPEIDDAARALRTFSDIIRAWSLETSFDSPSTAKHTRRHKTQLLEATALLVKALQRNQTKLREMNNENYNVQEQEERFRLETKRRRLEQALKRLKRILIRGEFGRGYETKDEPPPRTAPSNQRLKRLPPSPPQLITSSHFTEAELSSVGLKHEVGTLTANGETSGEAFLLAEVQSMRRLFEELYEELRDIFNGSGMESTPRPEEDIVAAGKRTSLQRLQEGRLSGWPRRRQSGEIARPSLAALATTPLPPDKEALTKVRPAAIIPETGLGLNVCLAPASRFQTSSFADSVLTMHSAPLRLSLSKPAFSEEQEQLTPTFQRGIHRLPPADSMAYISPSHSDMSQGSPLRSPPHLHNPPSSAESPPINRHHNDMYPARETALQQAAAASSSPNDRGMSPGSAGSRSMHGGSPSPHQRSEALPSLPDLRQPPDDNRRSITSPPYTPPPDFSGLMSPAVYHKTANNNSMSPDYRTAPRNDLSPNYRNDMSPGLRIDMSPGLRSEMSPGQRNEMSPGQRNEMSPGLRSEMSPGQRNEMSPGQRNEMSPGQRNEMSPGQRNEMSPGQRNEMSPGLRSEMSPGQRNEMSPGLRNEMSPGFRNEMSLSCLAEMSPSQRSEATPDSRSGPREISPNWRNEISPNWRSEMSPGQHGARMSKSRASSPLIRTAFSSDRLSADPEQRPMSLEQRAVSPEQREQRAMSPEQRDQRAMSPEQRVGVQVSRIVQPSGIPALPNLAPDRRGGASPIVNLTASESPSWLTGGVQYGCISPESKGPSPSVRTAGASLESWHRREEAMRPVQVVTRTSLSVMPTRSPSSLKETETYRPSQSLHSAPAAPFRELLRPSPLVSAERKPMPDTTADLAAFKATVSPVCGDFDDLSSEERIINAVANSAPSSI